MDYFLFVLRSGGMCYGAHLCMNSWKEIRHEYPFCRADTVSTTASALSCCRTTSGWKPSGSSDSEARRHRTKCTPFFWSAVSASERSISMLLDRYTADAVRMRRVCEYSPRDSVLYFCIKKKKKYFIIIYYATLAKEIEVTIRLYRPRIAPR